MAVNQSNLPSIQRLKYEDYVHSTDWKQALQALISALNLFINPVYNILNGGVTYMNLTIPQVFTKVITAATATTFSFVNPLPIPPQAVLIGNVWTSIPSSHPTGSVSVFWHYTGGSIIIDNIIGLSSGTQYTVVLVIL